MSTRLAFLLVLASSAAQAAPIVIAPAEPFEGDTVTVEGSLHAGPSTRPGGCRAETRVITRATRAATELEVVVDLGGTCGAFTQPFTASLGALRAGSYVVQIGGDRLAFTVAPASADPGVLDEVQRLQLAVAEAVPSCNARPGTFSPCDTFVLPRKLLLQLRKARPRLADAELALLAGQMARVSIAITSPTTFAYEVTPVPSILSFPCVAEFTLRGTGTRGATVAVGAPVEGRQLRACDPRAPQ